MLFYCHFPDYLLARPRTTLHRLYRTVLDNLEETTTGQAHIVLVNSRYTQGVLRPISPLSGALPSHAAEQPSAAGIFYQAFPKLRRRAFRTQARPGL